uniref:Zinc finger and BTB domain-containing protein 41 n=1 Tax=Tetraodon nigroviridis TaxID=99883 RepID=H3CQU1_TETNG
QQGQNLLGFLNRDQTRQQFCDVMVSVGGNLHRAHKVVLAHGSSYFHAELSKNPAAEHVTLDHVEDSVFRHLLELLYTSECFIMEKDVPALIRAARFLDMMDVLKLLSGDGDPAGEGGVRAAEAEPAGDADIHSSGSLCSAESLRGDASESPRRRSAEGQADVCQEVPAETETATASTRRSTRRRRTPTKFGRNSPARPGLGDEETPETGAAEEDEGGTNEEEARTTAEEQEGRTRSDHPSVPEVETESSTRGPVYPEGLAPVIIHTSNKKTLKCPKCDKTFDRAGKYQSHTRVHTGEKPFQCDVCLQRYSTKSNLTFHKKKHSGDAPFQKKEHTCPFCSKLHASKKTLSKHVKRFHPEHVQEFLTKRKKKSEGWKCGICLKTFTRRPHLQEHMILHTQDRPFKCSLCDEFFKSRFARLKHQEKFHLGPFPCEICGRQFNDTGNRKRHMECTHGGKRKWTCFVCGKSVRERTTLKEHLRIHSGEKPHLCSICGQSFRHGSSYRLHLRVHHDDKRYECDQCGKTFIRHDHLTKHQKIHSGEKAHQCEECGKCFRRHDHLTVHYKSIHLGEKVWQKYKTAVHQCDVCKKEFKGKSSLEMHFRTHSGEKPHRCPECNQTFRIKKTLTKHMVIHSDARPFSCPHCASTFKRKDKLKYHLDHVHSTVHRPLPAPGEDKTTPAAPFEEASKSYDAEPKAAPANVCVPVTLVPVQLAVRAQRDHRGAPPLPSQTHTGGVDAPPLGRQQNSGYQPTAELAFLEKYALSSQPAGSAHGLRPDPMMDQRDQSYLGTLLGLESSSVPNISSHDHTR